METKGRKIMIRKLALTLTMAASLLMAGVSFAHEHEGGEKHEKHEKHEMAAPKVGEMAPAFTAKDINGETVSLADLKGKTVVLEWTNHECPFVMKHYETGNMQAAQEKAAEMGVTWISIVSSAKGNQGAVTAEEAKMIVEEKGAKAAHRISDPKGEIGHMYAAKTTPHMFVIDAEGVLRYQGAIDDNPSPRQSTVEGAKNYVLEALMALDAGEEIEVTESRPYGCSVKY